MTFLGELAKWSFGLVVALVLLHTVYKAMTFETYKRKGRKK